MHDDARPPCIIRQAPNIASISVDINYLKNPAETENLLDDQEELVGTPLQIDFHSTV